MRRRGNREVNIFSMSALDLFASALGAFILIAIIALPYYLNTTKTPTPPQPKPPQPLISKKDLASLKKQLAMLKGIEQQLQKLQQTTDSLKQKVSGLEAKNDKLSKANDNLNQKIKGLEKEKSKLEKEIENSIKFALLGIMTKAKSFVILVDMSGSMDEYTDIISDTFNQIIDSLSDSHEIQIIGFKGDNSANLYEWNNPRNMKLLDGTAKRSAKRFMNSLMNKFDSGTPTHEALREALKYDSEGILLLTDGAPNNSDYNSIVSDITSRNNGQKEINCIAIGNYRTKSELVDFLEKLSKNNKGGFIGVSNIAP